MGKPFQVWVFGKAGCDKCKLLQKRLDEILSKDNWPEFEKVYVDVETEEGLVAFCRTECVNPQRIPAFVVAALDESTGRYLPIPLADPGESASVFGRSKLHHVLGLQTDYSSDGRGVISPRMIRALLKEARESTAVPA